MIETIMYKCEHCMKVYKHKSSAKSHEKKCYWNTETKSCMTCRRYIQTNVTDPMKVIGEETMCYFAEHNGYNYNCKGWREDIID